MLFQQDAQVRHEGRFGGDQAVIKSNPFINFRSRLRVIDQHTLLLRVGDATSLKVSGPGILLFALGWTWGFSAFWATL